MSTYQLRDAQQEDLAAIHALNESVVPHVNSIGMGDFQWFLEHADLFKVAARQGEAGDGLIGFIIALLPGTDYKSMNYQWFCRTYDSFLYIDRIVIERAERGQGIGQMLYRQLEAFAAEKGVPRLTCEVNIKPSNEKSIRFHQQFGFEKVGSQFTEDGSKHVALLSKSLVED